MSFAQTLRIFALLAVIFVAGLVTGRLTAPRQPIMVVTANGRIQTPETALLRLQQHLTLSDAQRRDFQALFEELATDMNRAPAGSVERMKIFQRYIPRMEALLRPDQREAFQRYIRDTETKFSRMLQRRGELPPK